MHYNYRYILIVIFYHEQETFNVLIIKYINFIAYIERQIN